MDFEVFDDVVVARRAFGRETIAHPSAAVHQLLESQARGIS
jgi:hypothetical protein